MDLETRVANLENLVAALIDMMDNNKYYTDADIAGCRHTESGLSEKNETQDMDITDLGDAIVEMSEIVYA